MSRQDKISVPFEVGTSLAPSRKGFDLEVGLRLRFDKIANLEAIELKRNGLTKPTRRQLWQLADRMYEARRTRDRLLGTRLFGEPAWDMMLALYCLPPRGEVLSVTGLCYAGAVKQTTGLRWQAMLIKHGMIARGPSLDGDGRRVVVALTDRGKRLMEEYLTRLFFCDAPVLVVANAERD